LPALTLAPSLLGMDNTREGLEARSRRSDAANEGLGPAFLRLGQSLGDSTETIRTFLTNVADTAFPKTPRTQLELCARAYRYNAGAVGQLIAYWSEGDNQPDQVAVAQRPAFKNENMLGLLRMGMTSALPLLGQTIEPTAANPLVGLPTRPGLDETFAKYNDNPDEARTAQATDAIDRCQNYIAKDAMGTIAANMNTFNTLVQVYASMQDYKRDGDAVYSEALSTGKVISEGLVLQLPDVWMIFNNKTSSNSTFYETFYAQMDHSKLKFALTALGLSSKKYHEQVGSPIPSFWHFCAIVRDAVYWEYSPPRILQLFIQFSDAQSGEWANRDDITGELVRRRFTAEELIQKFYFRSNGLVPPDLAAHIFSIALERFTNVAQMVDNKYKDDPLVLEADYKRGTGYGTSNDARFYTYWLEMRKLPISNEDKTDAKDAAAALNAGFPLP